MSYQSWSVVFGEQPSAAKWNILGSNDASFNDGTGIFGLYKDLLAVDSNPYKFSAYLNTNQTISNNTATVVLYETEFFDTNSNFDITTNKGRYTVPVSGFYQINVNASGGTGSTWIVALRKNGTEYLRLSQNSVGGWVPGSTLLQLAASDYLEVQVYQLTGGNVTLNGASGGAALNVFSGYLVSRT